MKNEEAKALRKATMSGVNQWGAFYTTLNRVGPQLLRGIHPELDEYIRLQAEDSDDFYSSWLEGDYQWWVDGDRERAVRQGLEDWVDNVKIHLTGLLGPDSLFPFEYYRISDEHRAEMLLSVDKISLGLDEWHIRTFIDSVLLDRSADPDLPGLLVQGIVTPYEQTAEGELIRSMAVPWRMIVHLLSSNWQKAFEIPGRQWEEMIAAAFDQAGYERVTLTPRSRDHGRDVIAEKGGVGSIRIIASVKAYRPDNPVRHDDVRSLAGVLHGDQNASKGIITTTSSFAPGIASDPYLKPLMPYRLELMDGIKLKQWLEELSLMGDRFENVP